MALNRIGSFQLLQSDLLGVPSDALQIFTGSFVTSNWDLSKGLTDLTSALYQAYTRARSELCIPYLVPTGGCSDDEVEKDSVPRIAPLLVMACNSTL